MNDLWPKGLLGDEAELPVTPIIEQAKLLETHTWDLVKAEVLPVDSATETFRFDFDLVVNVLDYRFTLFTIEYGAAGYPAKLILHSKIAKELGISARNIDSVRQIFVPAIDVQDKDELVQQLAAILGSQATKQILETLVAQAKQRRGVGV